MNRLLEARGLCAFYGTTQVLFGIDISIDEGGITTLLGANGAGKTTTLRSLSGMCRTHGDVVFQGKSIAGRGTEDIVRLGIAHVPQGRGTFSRQTVEENLEIDAMTRRDRKAIAADIGRVYAYFPRLKKRHPHHPAPLSPRQPQILPP